MLVSINYLLIQKISAVISSNKCTPVGMPQIIEHLNQHSLNARQFHRKRRLFPTFKSILHI